MDRLTSVNGGIQYTTLIAAVKQLIYLDFDGELTSYCNADLGLNVDGVSVEDSGLTAERIAAITASLNDLYAGKNVLFVSERPVSGDYSTIYVGRTSAFDSYGHFAGLAETVDSGNQIKNDNAFVILDSTSDNAQIIETIAHEAGHLLGTLDHGGVGLEKYAKGQRYDVSSGVTSTGLFLYNDSMFVSGGGKAYNNIIGNCGSMYVSSGGIAKDTIIDYMGYLCVSSGGIADNTAISGIMWVFKGGRANSSIVGCNSMFIWSGGFANYTTVNTGGRMVIYKGGTALSIKENGGYVFVDTGTNVTFIPNVLNELSNYSTATVHSGTTANNTTVKNKSYFYVCGGIANNTSVYDYGLMWISSGTADKTTVDSYGSMWVSCGGTAVSTCVKKNGNLIISSGGIAINTVITNGSITVLSGGTVGILISNPWDAVYICSSAGAVVTSSHDALSYWGSYGFLVSKGNSFSDVILADGNSIINVSGGLADNIIVNSGGKLTASYGGIISNATVSVGGEVTVSSGGTAFVKENGGYVFVEDDRNVSFEPNYFADLVLDHNKATIHSGTTAKSLIVNTSGYLHISSGGTVNNTAVNSGGCLYVSNGGIARETAVNPGGYLYVSSGATATISFNPWQAGKIVSAPDADVTKLDRDVNVYWGCFSTGIISKGNVLSNFAVSSGQSVIVYSGGKAESVSISRCGVLTASSGGIAIATVVDNAGKLFVHSGGTALRIKENGGYVSADSGANLTFLSNSFFGSTLTSFMTLHSGTTANSTVINSYGNMYVLCSGTASDTTVNAYANIYISKGGIAEKTTINSRGELYVSSGGAARKTTITAGGDFYVFDGGIAKDSNIRGGLLTVSNGGLAQKTFLFGGGLCVSSGGTAAQVTLNDQGTLYVHDGGSASIDFSPWECGDIISSAGACITYLDRDANVYFGESGYGIISKGNTLSDLEVSSGQSIIVYSGGIANKISVESGGCLCVSSGGSAMISFNPWQGGNIISATGANIILLNRDAGVYFGGPSNEIFSKGDTLSDLTVAESQSVIIYSNGTANSTILNSGGNLFVSGGTANEVIANSGGTVSVFHRGIVNSITLNDEGELKVGGSVNGITINSAGRMYVSNEGMVNRTTVNYFGWMYVLSGGTADVTEIKSAGRLFVSDGGVVNSTTINASGWLFISSGGVAKETVVNIGQIFVSSGGTALATELHQDGKMTVFSGGSAEILIDDPWAIGSVASSAGADISYSYDTKVYFGGNQGLISKGCLLTDKNVSGGMSMLVLSGGTADCINLASGGFLSVASGGSTTKLIFNSGAELSIEKNAVISGMEIMPDAVYVLHSGYSGYDWTVSAFGNLSVSGGHLYGLNIVSGAACTLKDGYVSGLNQLLRGSAYITNGIIDNLVMGSSARLECSASGRNGAVVSSSVVNGGIIGSNASAFFRLHTTASDLTVSKAGILYVDNGGTACSTTIDRMGRFVLFGTADCTFLNGGSMYIGDSSCRIFDSTGGSVTSNQYDNDLVANYNVLSSSWLHVYSGGSAKENIVNSNSWLHVYHGGSAINTEVNSSGYIVAQDSGTIDTVIVHSGGYMRLEAGATLNSEILIGGLVTVESAGTSATEDVIRAYGADLKFLLTERSTSDESIITNLGMIQGATYYTVVNNTLSGTYRLADGAKDFTGSISVENAFGTELGTLAVGETKTLGNASYTLSKNDSVLSLTIGGGAASLAKSDVDGNGVSDVMFQYTGGNYQIGFWMNGSSTWQGTGASQPANWELLGNYDMNNNGKADQVMFGNVLGGAYVGYYKDGDTTSDGWQNIGLLSNPNGIEWKNAVGNLTGNAGCNSIVWQAPELGALGVWTDGTSNWVSLGNGYNENWVMQGCGDFNGDGKDEVLFTFGGNLYSTDIDGNFAALGGWGEDWSVKAIGNFGGDEKDDVVLQNGNMVVKFNNGKADDWESLGILDSSDWFICGAGDYNGDQKDDLLIRQISTGMLGYYSAGDMSQWTELGRGIDSNWTVVA